MEIFSDSENVTTSDFPDLGCKRLDSLECLSGVPYPGRMVKAYWKYTDPITLKEYKVDDIHCNFRPKLKCESPDIGWRSARGIYRKDKRYFNVLRLGMVSEEPAVGLFTCHIEEDSKSPVSVYIVESESNIIIVIFHREYSTLLFLAVCIKGV